MSKRVRPGTPSGPDVPPRAPDTAGAQCCTWPLHEQHVTKDRSEGRDFLPPWEKETSWLSLRRGHFCVQPYCPPCRLHALVFTSITSLKADITMTSPITFYVWTTIPHLHQMCLCAPHALGSPSEGLHSSLSHRRHNRIPPKCCFSCLRLLWKINGSPRPHYRYCSTINVANVKNKSHFLLQKTEFQLWLRCFKSITPRSPESAAIKPHTSASLRHISDSGNIKRNCL